MSLVLVFLSILGLETQKNVNVSAAALAPACVSETHRQSLLASPTAPPKTEQTVGNNAAFLPYRAEPCCSGVDQKITCFPKGGKLNAPVLHALASGALCSTLTASCLIFEFPSLPTNALHGEARLFPQETV